MRKKFSPEVEEGRNRSPSVFGTSTGNTYGVFRLRGPTGQLLSIVVGDATGALQQGLPPWDHVSVSTANRTPTWEEMNWVKDQFFEEEECVIQFHPPRSKYINCNPHVLHLWRQDNVEFVLPPAKMV